MNRQWAGVGLGVLLGVPLLLLGGCGGPQRAQATAIPAGVVRPVQPTPRYPGGADVFSLLTPGATPQFVPSPAAEDALAVVDESGGQQRAAIKLFIENQTPSAVGISPGGTAIFAERGGRTLATVPAGGVLTVTGKSADGAWYSAYNENAVFGWVPAGQLRVYGGEDLVVVETAPDPAPVATLLAQADEPVHVLDDLMATLAVSATMAASQPAAAPAAVQPAVQETPEPTLEAALVTPTAAETLAAEAATMVPAPGVRPGPPAAPPHAIVVSDARLNLRTAPGTGAAIVRKLEPGADVTILERSADGTWLRLQLDDGTTGWAAAEYVNADLPQGVPP
jgi:hypothetical protein